MESRNSLKSTPVFYRVYNAISSRDREEDEFNRSFDKQRMHTCIEQARRDSSNLYTHDCTYDFEIAF